MSLKSSGLPVLWTVDPFFNFHFVSIFTVLNGNFVYYKYICLLQARYCLIMNKNCSCGADKWGCGRGDWRGDVMGHQRSQLDSQCGVRSTMGKMVARGDPLAVSEMQQPIDEEIEKLERLVNLVDQRKKQLGVGVTGWKRPVDEEAEKFERYIPLVSPVMEKKK